jgi:hypothetical protein
VDLPITTVPLYLEQDRPFIDLTLTGAAGQVRTVRCWVDTGASNLRISEPLARDLGLTWTPSPEHPNIARVDPPGAYIGDHSLDLTGTWVLVKLDGPLDPGLQTEAIFGSQILGRRHVVFDYPNRTFTIAPPGALEPRGVPVHSPFVPGICFPRLEVEIDGERHGLLLDTGATCTMISTRLLTALTERHPDWPQTTGAAGVANMLGEADARLPLVRIPQMTAGDLRFDDVLVVGRFPGTFEQWMSQWMTAPIIGTSRACGYPEGDVQPGDRLLAVDGRPVLGLSRPEVLAALRGAPGEVRRLTIERRGDMAEVSLPVVKLI